MRELVVYYVDDEGVPMPIEGFPHKLCCDKTTACAFPACACGPEKPVLDGKLRPSYEQQVAAAQKKTRA